VRTVYRFDREPPTYEERITLWRSGGFADAVALAEQDAHEYAGLFADCAYVGLAQAYGLAEEPGHGAEIFSLMRDSDLPADTYLNTFFDTGGERQGTVTEP
jgi:hypothetical protein